MRSGVWFVAGAAAGVYAMVKARRVAEAVTPEGLTDRAHAVRLGARLLREEVSHGRLDAEAELRERLRSVAEGTAPQELEPRLGSTNERGTR